MCIDTLIPQNYWGLRKESEKITRRNLNLILSGCILDFKENENSCQTITQLLIFGISIIFAQTLGNFYLCNRYLGAVIDAFFMSN